jgi:hypothetical protein
MATTVGHGALGPARRLRPSEQWFEGALLGGLAGVFLVNALVAVLQPSDFTRLVDSSLFGRWFPALTGGWTPWMIGINDLLLGLSLVAAIRSPRVRPLVLAWAGVWLLAVTVIKVTSLHAFGG